MEINLETYEAFMLDYQEGNLSEKATTELLLFLDNHPELKEDLETELPTLDIEDWIVFDHKENLKKTVDYARFEDLILHEVDDISSSDQKRELHALLNLQPELETEVSLFKQTKLKAETIVFPFKKDLLKKEGKLIFLFNSHWGKALLAAASVALLFGISQLSTNEHQVYLADTEVIESGLITENDSSLEQLIDRIKSSSEAKVIPIIEKNLAVSIPVKEEIENGDTTDFKTQKIELIPEYKFANLNKGTGELIASNEMQIIPQYQNLTLVEKAIALVEIKKDEYVPDNWKEMKKIDQMAYTTSKISEVARVNLGLNTERNDKGKLTGWSVKLGKLRVSRE